MFDLSQKKNKFILGGFVIIGLVVMYFLHDFYTRRLIHNELKKIAKAKKRKNTKLLQNKKKNENIDKTSDDDTLNNYTLNDDMQYKPTQQKHIQRDMDSYIDPDAEHMENMNESHNSQGSSKFNQSNIMMRDMMEGF